MGNIFDILGPVMVGPSSSHTAGAARIGMVARQLFGQMCIRDSVKSWNRDRIQKKQTKEADRRIVRIREYEDTDHK